MRLFSGLLLLFAALPALAQAQPATPPGKAPPNAQPEGKAISIEDLQGVTISGVVNYAGRFRTNLGESTSTIVWNYRLKVGPGPAVAMSYTRNVHWQAKDGPKTASLSKSLTGTIGVPREAGKEATLWLLDGNTLVLLRVFEVGGVAMRIALTQKGSDLSCSATAPMARETGAGNTRTQAAVGGKVEMLSIRQTSSSCRVSKG